MFCPKTGSLLVPKILNNKKVLMCSEGGKIEGTCKVCGYDAESQTVELKEKGEDTKIIEVIEKIETNPKIKAKCERCNNHIAYYWTQQTRGADEPETRFFKCTKCNHTWREYA